MRNHIIAFAVAAVALATALCSCSDETIGGSITDTRSLIVADSSFTITGSSVASEHLRSRSSQQLIGVVTSPGYGTLQSDVVTEFMPTVEITTARVTPELIDSCRLELYINTGDFTGDSVAPMRMTVFPLVKRLPNPIYSDFDPTDYVDFNMPLGNATYSANALQQGDSINSFSYRKVVVPMPVATARALFNKYKESPETFRTPSAFAEYFPGLYITNTYGQGHVMNFNQTIFKAFFRKEQSGDSVFSQAYMSATPEVVYNNNINLLVDPSVQARVDNGEAIVMSPAGFDTRVRFPIEEMVTVYRKNTQEGVGIINTVSLTLPVEEVENVWGVAPPKNLLMVKSAMRDHFFEADTLPNNRDSFVATYNAVDKCYEFDEMRNYVIDIVKNKGGVPLDEDLFFTITPVDVSIYSTETAYSTTATTTVTKIAPAVSKPAIAKILLEKAKIKITFSRQSIE